MTFQTGPLIQTQVPESFVNLSMGQPSPVLLPKELLASAAAKSLQASDRLLLQYGTCPGGEPFRKALSSFLSQAFSAQIPAEQLMASNAISGALAIVFGTFAEKNKLVVSEDPTYFLARDVFTSSGAEVTGVPVDEGGLVVEELERRLVGGLRPAMVYTIPTHQNPTSVSLTQERRKRLIELAEQYNFYIVADEPYNLLSFTGEFIKPFAFLDEGRGRVISLGSFSKIFGPGLRLGWIHAAPALIDKITKHGVLSSGGGLNPVVSEIVKETLLDGSLAQHLVFLQKSLGERRLALAAALQKVLPELQFTLPTGGYFIWAKLPTGVSAPVLWDIGQKMSVSFMPGTRCSLSGAHQDRIRLSFSFYEPHEFEACVTRLKEAIEVARKSI